MFAIIPPPTAGSFSSPLSPRDVNLPTRRAFPMSRSKPEAHDSKKSTNPSSSPLSSPSSRFPSSSPAPQSSSPPSFYAQRYASTIQNPAGRIAQRGLSRDKRRDRFLDRVRRGRDENAFDARAEQMQRMECLSQRREFLESMASAAPDFGYLEEEDEDEDEEQGPGDWREGKAERASDFTQNQRWVELQNEGGQNGWPSGYDEDALEELISEEQRFENFIEEMEGARDGNQREEITYDDDDYDILFASLSPGASGNNSQSHDRMDTSHG